MQDTPGGNHPERHDNAGLHQANLEIQHRGRESDFLFGGRAGVEGLARLLRAEFDKVGDIDLLAGETHGLEHAVQLAAGRTLKRFTRFLIMIIHRIAHKHDIGREIPLAEHRGRTQRAEAAQRLPVGQQALHGFPCFSRILPTGAEEGHIILRAGFIRGQLRLRDIIQPQSGAGGFRLLHLRLSNGGCGHHGRRGRCGHSAAVAGGQHPGAENGACFLINRQALNTLLLQGAKIIEHHFPRIHRDRDRLKLCAECYHRWR